MPAIAFGLGTSAGRRRRPRRRRLHTAPRPAGRAWSGSSSRSVALECRSRRTEAAQAAGSNAGIRRFLDASEHRLLPKRRTGGPLWPTACVMLDWDDILLNSKEVAEIARPQSRHGQRDGAQERTARVQAGPSVAVPEAGHRLFQAAAAGNDRGMIARRRRAVHVDDPRDLPEPSPVTQGGVWRRQTRSPTRARCTTSSRISTT